MYEDYYLEFQNENQANAILYGTAKPNKSKIRNINIIGTVYNDDGIYDDDGNIILEPTTQDGFFAIVRVPYYGYIDVLDENGNVIGREKYFKEDISEIIPYGIISKTQTRKWR